MKPAASKASAVALSSDSCDSAASPPPSPTASDALLEGEGKKHFNQTRHHLHDRAVDKAMEDDVLKKSRRKKKKDKSHVLLEMSQQHKSSDNDEHDDNNGEKAQKKKDSFSTIV